MTYLSINRGFLVKKEVHICVVEIEINMIFVVYLNNKLMFFKIFSHAKESKYLKSQKTALSSKITTSERPAIFHKYIVSGAWPLDHLDRVGRDFGLTLFISSLDILSILNIILIGK